MSSMGDHRLTRRELLAATTATALTATAASAGRTAGALAPSSAYRANDRIQFGVIGVGNMGGGHVGSLTKRGDADNVRVVAVSDVYQRRITHARSVCGGDGYSDYRKLLERKDVDAILIATPDHWHAKLATEALEAGKHVYCEKPMTHTVEQAIQLRNAARSHAKQVFQVGPNATGDDAF